MRRPNRNIEIFSMSVLDLFASALGGFILIAVILFPNYRKTAMLEQRCLATFGLVQIDWKSVGPYDVDLHVTEPGGAEFFFARSNQNGQDYAGSESQLSVDATGGPGLEIWQTPNMVPGRYTIEYEYYRAPPRGGAVTVQGGLYYRNGRIALPEVTLTNKGERVRVATVVVADDGEISFEGNSP